MMSPAEGRQRGADGFVVGARVGLVCDHLALGIVGVGGGAQPHREA